MKQFEKNFNMYVIPKTRNCFKVTVRQENKKPMFICCYSIVVRSKYQDGVEIKIKKMYDKQDALRFVSEMYDSYMSKIER